MQLGLRPDGHATALTDGTYKSLLATDKAMGSTTADLNADS